VYQKLGDTVQAISSYHRSARLLRTRGFNQKAIALYKIILRLDPHDSEAMTQSGKVMWEIEAEKTSPHAGRALSRLFDQAKNENTPLELSVGEAQSEGDHDRSGEWLQTNSYAPSQDPPVEREETDATPPESGPSFLNEGKSAGVPKLFSGMSDEEFSKLLQELEVKTFSGNERVIEEGDSGDSMYLIESGRAKVTAHLLGKEVELALLGKGDLFGEVAFLTGRPRTAEVVALGPLRVFELGRLDIERIIERNPEVLSRIEDFYESRAKDTIEKIRSRRKKP
jgi:CRP-like cAMP-binding protein